MGLETVTYISDLVASNPVGATDPKSQGDDHIRNIKTALLATFPNIDAPITATEDELNILDGVTAVAADLNLLAGAVAGASLTLGLATVTLGPSGARITLNGTEIDLTGTTLDFNGAVDVSGNLQLNSSGDQLELTGSVVKIWLAETGVTADNGVWDIHLNGESWTLRAVNDARNAATEVIIVQRTGLTIDEFELNATLLDFNGSADIAGSVLINHPSSAANDRSLMLHSIANANWISFFDSDGTANTTKWLLGQTGQTFQLLSRNDADSSTTFTAISILHDGSEIELNATTFDFNGNLDISGTLTTPNASASEVGFKGLPAATDETPVLADAGKVINLTTNATIPANASIAYPVGTVLTFYNVSGSSKTIAITSDTMTLAGVGTTGTRTLADDGIATALKIASTSWLISGVGLS